MIILKKCVCNSAFQDEEYGENIRVHNMCNPAGNKFTKAGCTVCGKIKDIAAVSMADDTKLSKKEKKKGKK